MCYFYFIAILHLTVQVPSSDSFIKDFEKRERAVKNTLCSLLKDYLPGVFNFNEQLSDRCHIEKIGETALQIQLHMKSTGQLYMRYMCSIFCIRLPAGV